MSLVFKSEWLSITDLDERFWAFYKVNGTQFNKILWQAAWRHKDHVDPEDMHSELLLRMHRSDFLSAFDSTKAAFGTFVTGRVFGYSFHLLKKHTENLYTNGFDVMKRPKGSSSKYHGEKIDTAETADEAEGLSKHYIEEIGDKFVVEVRPVKRENLPALCHELNTVEEGDDDSLTDADISRDPEFDLVMSNKETVRRLCKELLPTQIKILAKYMEGSTHGQIAKSLNTSSATILKHVQKIKQTALKALDGEIKRDWRDLKDEERALIKKSFLFCDGRLTDFTRAFPCLLKKIGEDISPLQVYDYVNSLHALVEDGSLALEDRETYDKFMAEYKVKSVLLLD